MEPKSDGKPEPTDPQTDLRLIELELMRQRAERQKAGSPFRGLRAASFVFLFVVILAALAAYFYLMTSGRLEELRTRGHASPPSQVTDTPPP